MMLCNVMQTCMRLRVSPRPRASLSPARRESGRAAATTREIDNNDARSTTIGRAIACVYGLARACGNEPHLAVAHARGELVNARGEPLDV